MAMPIGINNAFENEEEMEQRENYNLCNFNVVPIPGRFNSIARKISRTF